MDDPESTDEAVFNVLSCDIFSIISMVWLHGSFFLSVMAIIDRIPSENSTLMCHAFKVMAKS